MIDQTYLSDATFQAALANCRRYWLNFGRELRRDDGISLFRSGVVHPQLNGVLRLYGADIDVLITQAQEQLAGVPCIWWVGPDSRPDALDALMRHGGARHGTIPVYALRLTDLPTGKAKPAGLVIEEVRDDRGLAEWVDCFAPSMGVTPDQVGRTLQMELDRPDAPGSFRRFAARIGGRMVATSALLCAEGIAGIYLCSTAEQHRRKGIATLMTLHAAWTAVEMGFEVVTLQASPMGQPVYERIGFKRIVEYNVVAF
ncbi:GNAT family N-acetyltransferase [Rhizobium sp. SAFR-030]|uniref:GNAT family N-acetyltransferase n=1 Tax=Rhizobium sp. SAFR-030 TaxID=3387277 RepID=UPI003F81ADF8